MSDLLLEPNDLSAPSIIVDNLSVVEVDVPSVAGGQLQAKLGLGLECMVVFAKGGSNLDPNMQCSPHFWTPKNGTRDFGKAPYHF